MEGSDLKWGYEPMACFEKGVFGKDLKEGGQEGAGTNASSSQACFVSSSAKSNAQDPHRDIKISSYGLLPAMGRKESTHRSHACMEAQSAPKERTSRRRIVDLPLSHGGGCISRALPLQRAGLAGNAGRVSMSAPARASAKPPAYI